MNAQPARPRHHFTKPEVAADDMLSFMSEMIRATLAMAPVKLQPFKPFNHTKWVLSASSRLVRQFRELGTACMGRAHSEEVTGIISDEPEQMTSQAMTNAWMLAIAQRTAVDIRQLEVVDTVRGCGAMAEVEINSVALLAGCTERDGSGARLTKALQNVACRTLELCDQRGARAQFLSGIPVQSISPLTKQSGLPFTTCRVRAEGISTEGLLEVLREAIRSAGGAENTPTGELLVMSNLWLDANA